jgi:hypothetical protein
MEFMQKRKEQMKINSIADLKRSGKVSGGLNSKLFVNGPEEFDCLVNKWSRQELTGLVGDSGVGKSEVMLDFAYSILKNNPQSAFVYVSLEMTDEKMAQRWFKKVEHDPELAERFYIISRYGEDGKAREISMEWIKKELVKYKEVIGDIAAFCVDHIHVLGSNDSSFLNTVMVKLKEMAVELNAHGFPMAQVNKGSGQKGEVPLDADAVLGCSQFKYICSDIIQIHRPILRLEEDAKISVVSWGYCKVREAHGDDKIKRGQNKLLIYDSTTRGFRKLSTAEFSTFKLYYTELLEMKSSEEKHKAHAYHLQKEITQPNGKKVVVNEIFSGNRDDF